MRLLLEGVVGSTAYGLATPASDIDFAGIYVEPTANLLGLHPPSRERATKKGRDGADATYHELGKSMGLMLSCNPTAMEILWLDTYTATTEFGRELIGLRDRFLSAQRVRDAFFGYATSQFHRLLDRGRFQGSLESRREKHARHTMRLLWQGLELYTTGVLPIRVPDPDRYFEFGHRILDDPEAKAAQALITEYEIKFDAARPVLPEHPDEPPLEDFLQRVRRAHLDTALASILDPENRTRNNLPAPSGDGIRPHKVRSREEAEQARQIMLAHDPATLAEQARQIRGISDHQR